MNKQERTKATNQEVISGILTGILLVILIFGLVQIPHYGISFDEGTELNTMLKTYAYADGAIAQILHKTPNPAETDYLSYADNIYGVAIRYPVYLIVKEMELGFRETFLLLHYYTYLWFIVSIFALYYLLKEMNYKKIVTLLSCILYMLSPRIFAEAAYNIKDSMFLSIFMTTLIAGIVALKKEKARYLLLFAFLTALSINTRCIGGIVLLIFCFLYGKKEYGQRKNVLVAIGKSLGVAIVTYFFFYLITPYLWSNPIRNTFNILTSFGDYSDGVMEMLFNGKQIVSNQLPFYYLLEWIILTTPIITLVFWGIGLVSFGKFYIKKMKKTKERKSPRINIISEYEMSLVILLLGILLLDAIFRPIKYDGWRHFYFLYGLLMIPVAKGIDFTYCYIQNEKKAIQITAAGLFSTCIAIVLIWMIQNHPYEYVYFNEIARCFEQDNFERDYWYVSTYDAIQEVLTISENETVKIFCVCKTVMYYLTDAERERIVFTDQPAEADYVILQYRDGKVQEFKEIFSDYTLISEKCTDGIPLYSIYSVQ